MRVTPRNPVDGAHFIHYTVHCSIRYTKHSTAVSPQVGGYCVCVFNSPLRFTSSRLHSGRLNSKVKFSVSAAFKCHIIPSQLYQSHTCEDASYPIAVTHT
ncbi:hypothetical protein Y032_0100g3253 [Ancylostoma ceylanicum]|uniref:Uncharacterized protein n=1 Tax=Ancylostoma ceylanicum TaxID=53326 RepID=A0A016TI56_9BILA|nr:hypothetical protein Y032_0100g3253 [Ancylostoma ceylanicum]